MTQFAVPDHETPIPLERLMSDYGTVLMRICCLYLKDIHLAEDAVQETFIKANSSIHRFHGESSIQTWLIRIAINTCRDIHRSAWYRFVNHSIAANALLPPIPEPQNIDDTVILCVASLPVKYKEVILLRYYQNMKLEEISAALSVPVQTVSSRLNRAKKKLRPKLERWYFDEE